MLRSLTISPLLFGLVLACGCDAGASWDASATGVAGKADELGAGLRGEVEQVFRGDVDPVVVPNVCITYVIASAPVDGGDDDADEPFPPGLYGLVESKLWCFAGDEFEDELGAEVFAAERSLFPIESEAPLTALHEFREATYFFLEGDLVKTADPEPAPEPSPDEE